MEQSIYLPIKEAAKRTGLSQHYIRGRVKAGELNTICAGKKYLVNMPRLIEQLEREGERHE